MAHDLARLMHALFLPASRDCGQTTWCPRADVYRTQRGWLIKLELAGVRPDDLTLSVRGRQLVIRGCRRDWTLEEGHTHHILEIAYSCFERTLELPAELEHCTLTTDYRDGMLLVSIRNEEARP